MTSFMQGKNMEIKKKLACILLRSQSDVCTLVCIRPKLDKIQWTRFFTDLDACHFFKLGTFKRDYDLFKINHPSMLLPHHWMFLLLDMIKFTRFYLAKLQTRCNMKLRLGTFQLALAWISLLWFQSHWGNMVNGCHVNTCTMYYNMSCFMCNLKFSFISQLGVAMKFVACWLGL
jgi:hypothetical protein